MESATTHHLQDQLVSSSSPSSCFGHPFTPPFFETKQQENTAVSSQLYTCSSMAPDAYNYWPNINNASTNHQDFGDGEQYYRRHTDILSSTDDKLLLKSFYGNLINKIPTTDLYTSHLTGFAQTFHVSSFNPTAVPVTTTGTGSLPMDFEALDRLASSRFSGIFKHGFSNYAFHQPPFYASNKVSSASSNAVVEAKRNSDDMPQLQNAPKKSRLEARSSCPPFKVRKEKLGDRIAALQQLVAPFGKTDTASVLMEAIGYIKFLQTQVETLSVPYMKASRNRVGKGAANENEYEDSKRDLKSRGLCLVPLSCLSYITDGGGAAVWPPPHFGGSTSFKV